MFTLYSFYRSKEWEKFRNIVINERRDKNGDIIDEITKKPIINKYDIILHHKIELTELNVNDFNISLNPANVMVISFKTHNMLHKRFEGFKQEVYLVYGSPCAGKSTWVNTVAEKDDFIVDIDRIWESICNSDKYNKPQKLKSIAFGIMDLQLDQVKTRTGKWHNAFVIGTYPLRSDRDRLCDSLRAKPIYIESTERECLTRAKNDKWKEYINDWFSIHT